MKLKTLTIIPALAVLLAGGLTCAEENVRADDRLARDFVSPPDSVRPWTYWMWPWARKDKGPVPDKEAITRDLSAMSEQGIKGVLVFPFEFYTSPEWPALFQHILKEAGRLNLEIVLNNDVGWSCTVPWMTPELAEKMLVHSVRTFDGGKRISEVLPVTPVNKGEIYCDVVVLACPQRSAAPKNVKGVSYEQLLKTAVRMKPSYSPGGLDVFYNRSAELAGSDDVQPGDTLDISSKMKPDGTLEWDAPAGTWSVMRFGYTTVRKHPDFFSRAALDHHLRQMIEKMVPLAGRSVGSQWIHVHEDSYESGAQTWTPGFPEGFRSRRGYDMTGWMPVLAGNVVGSRALSDRFLHDYRQTISDLYVENHFTYFAQRLEEMGLKFSTEGGYGWASPIADGLRIEATAEFPMGEVWHAERHPVTGNWLKYQFKIHSLNPADPLSRRAIPYGPGMNSVRLASSAARIYGRAFSQAETFTSYTRDTNGYDLCNSPFSVKTTADRAFCDGLGRVVFATYSLQPANDDKPGAVWSGVGLHFNRNITWWSKARAFTDYLSRCQLLLRQGKFVADFAYWTGDTVPYECPDRTAMRPALPAGCNADLVNTDVLMNRLRVDNGRLVLPNGISYRYLVLPPTRDTIDLKSLKKIVELVEAGATAVLGPRPVSAAGLKDYPRCDADVKALADRLWGEGQQEPTGRRVLGKGRVSWGLPLADVLKADGVPQDCIAPEGMNDWIHYRDEERDIYFLSNQNDGDLSGAFSFRVAGKQPELWDAVTGEIRVLPEYVQMPDGRTQVPLKFAPRQSLFVVFGEVGTDRRAVLLAAGSGGSGGPALPHNFPELQPVLELPGPWEVLFDGKLMGKEAQSNETITAVFEKLEDWTKRPEDGIKYYSGTATYRKTFDVKSDVCSPESAVYLDLGEVRDIAAVRLNGKNLGVVWCAPWQVDVSGVVRKQGNTLEIDVVNQWPNRLIGDSGLAADKQVTKTAYRRFKPDNPLMPSGLLGPVSIRSVNKEKVEYERK